MLFRSKLPAHSFQQAAFTLREGEEIDPQAVMARLIALGYERVPMVEGKGQCALLGDILNVFPPASDQAIRVEFFDIQVDSIRPFDVLTQRSAGRVDSVRIGPALEYFVPPQEREQAALRMEAALEAQTVSVPSLRAGATGFARDVEQLRDTGAFPNMQLWAGILYEETSPLTALLPDPIVVIDTPDRALSRLEERSLGFAEDLALALERGEAVSAQQTLLYTQDDVLAHLQQQPIVLMQELLRGLANLSPSLVLQMKGQGLSRYQGRYAELAADMKGWMADNMTVAILCSGLSRAERMQRALREFGCEVPIREEGDRSLSPGQPALLPLPFSRGFMLAEAELVILTDSDVLGSGQRKTKSRQTAGQKIEAFTDLSVGDYVVHEHHGIGVYQGTVRLQSEGAWRDYLFIQYRGTYSNTLARAMPPLPSTTWAAATGKSSAAASRRACASWPLIW